MQIDAWHITGLDAEPHTVLERDGVRARAPALDSARIERVCRELIAARSHLAGLPVSAIIRAVDRAARSISDPAGEGYPELLHGIATFTGYAPAMAAHVLERMSRDWLEPSLTALLDSELGGAQAIDGFVQRPDGSRSRAIAPPLGFHVFSGNVPGVSVTSIVRALLVKSAVFGKCAAAEPLLAPAFARALYRADPRVGACVAVSYWPGGDAVREAAVLRHARLVVHYGGADAIASLRARAPADVRFIEHGPRTSFAVIHERAADAATARALALAVALFDQQGCVSPQMAFVIGGAQVARSFAGMLADALGAIAAELPRGRLDAAEAAAVRELRTRAEFRAIAGQDVELWGGDDLDYSVICEPDARFGDTCLNRTITVASAPDLEAVLRCAQPLRSLLQTVGTAGFDPPELHRLAAQLGEFGVSRVAAIADMPWPPPTWHHDGRGPLRELVRWVDLEY